MSSRLYINILFDQKHHPKSKNTIYNPITAFIASHLVKTVLEINQHQQVDQDINCLNFNGKK